MPASQSSKLLLVDALVLRNGSVTDLLHGLFGSSMLLSVILLIEDVSVMDLSLSCLRSSLMATVARLGTELPPSVLVLVCPLEVELAPFLIHDRAGEGAEIAVFFSRAGCSGSAAEEEEDELLEPLSFISSSGPDSTMGGISTKDGSGNVGEAVCDELSLLSVETDDLEALLAACLLRLSRNVCSVTLFRILSFSLVSFNIEALLSTSLHTFGSSVVTSKGSS
mmetsp:Transcript_84271/g.131579  ORF Transcript_84271/g.131579 Transcript_84271/m.131579 type:complete len:223 (+) Transcript_84271:184-852(+)